MMGNHGRWSGGRGKIGLWIAKGRLDNGCAYAMSSEQKSGVTVAWIGHERDGEHEP